MNKNILFSHILSTGSVSQAQYYLYHDTDMITPRAYATFRDSEFAYQIFPVVDFEDDDYYWIYVGGDAPSESPVYGNTLDKMCLMRKAKNDGLHISKGWSYYGSPNPTVILGMGGLTCEKKAKVDVRCATTGNITLSGEQTISTTIGGSKAVVTGDRVLVKDQTDAKQNGIYVVDSGAWTRSTDSDSSTELTDLLVYATEDAVLTSSFWYQTAVNPVIGVDNIVFAEKNWDIAQNFLGTIIPKDGGGYLAMYTANGPIVSSAYGCGVLETSDLINFTRTSHEPLIAATGVSQHIHSRFWRRSDDLCFLFTHGFGSGTEGRIYHVSLHTFTWDDDPANWVLTDRSSNLFHGKIQQENCLGEMSNLWASPDGGNKVRFYSSRNAKWGYPANQGKTTQSSIQGTICEIEMDLTDPANITFSYVNNDLYSTSQMVDMAYIALCGQRTYQGNPFTWVTFYKWRAKQILSVEAEQWSSGKVLAKSIPPPGEFQTANRESYPTYMDNGYFIRVDQPQEASLTPKVLKFANGQVTEPAVTIVGSPTRTPHASIQAASGAYLYIDEGIVIDPKYFAMKFIYQYTFINATFPMLVFHRESDGAEIIKVEHVSNRFQVTVRNGSGLYKTYRTIRTMAGSPGLIADNLNVNKDGCSDFGFIWANGTLTLCALYNTNCDLWTPLIKDDVFTDIGLIGDRLRIGVGHPTTSYNQNRNGSIIILNGQNNATAENWVKTDLI